jgi:hypothetical protein
MKDELNERINKAYHEILSETMLNEKIVKMTSVYVTKNTAKIRNDIMKWAKSNNIPALYSDPFHPKLAVSISSDHLKELTDKFDSSYIKQIGGEQEYMVKKDELKAVGGSGGKQTRGAFGGYKPEYEKMWVR